LWQYCRLAKVPAARLWAGQYLQYLVGLCIHACKRPLGSLFRAETRLGIVLRRTSRTVAALSIRVKQHADMSGRVTQRLAGLHWKYVGHGVDADPLRGSHAGGETARARRFDQVQVDKAG
jgi:hypothetical protein